MPEELDREDSQRRWPASLPTIAVEVLRLKRSDEVETEELANVIEKDKAPVLTANILTVVNAPDATVLWRWQLDLITALLINRSYALRRASRCVWF